MNSEKDKTGSKKDKRENNCELYHWPLKSSAKYWTKSLKFSSKNKNLQQFCTLVIFRFNNLKLP